MTETPPSDIALGYRRQRQRLSLFGIWSTALYIGVVVTVVVCKGPSALWSLPLNAIGDFLAGAFAPLAFLWLVIGYRQQNIELSLNTDTLVAQLEEMRQMVEEQAKQTTALVLDESHARRAAILKMCDIYMSQLAGSASIVTLYARGLSHDWIEAGWRYYSGGDRDFFFRTLLPGHAPPNSLTGQLTTTMGNSTEAAAALHSYVDVYERFTAQVRQLDTENNFLPLFESGHSGRLYRAMKLVEHAVQRAPNLI